MAVTAREAFALFLRRLMLRSPLTEAEQAAVLGLEAASIEAVVRGDIVSPGERVSFACLVADGAAGRFDQMADGRRQNVAFYIPGDMCDLPSVVLPIAGWGITALTPSTIIRVPHEALREAADQHPALATAFWRDTVADAAALAKAAANIGRKDAQARLAHLFCELGIRMEAAGLGTRTHYRLPVNQEQLADATGLTSVHVNRMLRMLREAGLVEFRGQQVEVTDPQRLASVAEFDPRYLLLDRDSETQGH